MVEFGFVLIVKSYCEKKAQESSTSRPGYGSDQTVRPQTGKLAWNKPVKILQNHFLHLLFTI